MLGDVHLIPAVGMTSSKVFSDFIESEVLKSEAKNNYTLGVALRFEIGNILYIQPGCYLTRKGGVLASIRDEYADSIFQSVNYNCIDAPILFGLRLFHSNVFCMRFYTGPVVSFTYKENYNLLKNSNSLSDFVEKNTHILSFQIGAGFDIGRFTADVGYEWGATRIYKIQDLKTKNKILNVTVGFKLL
ncbi:hypothetical protein FACS1894201_00490 [Bacteroidia bacterium]|nr:hypothetical protein FACS1894201_00490 [Bacteroidia bacterium]